MTGLEELLQRATELVPLLRQRAAHAEELRRIPQGRPARRGVAAGHSASALRWVGPRRQPGLKIGRRSVGARRIMQYDTQDIVDRANQEVMPSLDDRVRYRRDQAYMPRPALWTELLRVSGAPGQKITRPGPAVLRGFSRGSCPSLPE